MADQVLASGHAPLNFINPNSAALFDSLSDSSEMANRDFKHSSRASRGHSTSRDSGGGGGMVAGIVIGLIVGVAVAVGIVMYLNKSKTPFSNLENMEKRTQASAVEGTELLAPDTQITDASTAPVPPVARPMASAPASLPTPPVEAANSANTAGQNANPNDERFDFYKILPGQGDALPEENKPAKAGDTSNKKVYLQLGAFQDQNEADNFKAELALKGVEAKIQSVNLPNKGMVHRVRMGPYSRVEDLEKARQQLKQEGINATKVE